jgi:uncharacterized protein
LLTADLVRARRRGNELKLGELDAKSRAEALELAAQLIDLCAQGLGQSRAELDEVCDAVVGAARDRRMAAGLYKLVSDRCDFNEDATISPIELRREVFERSRAAWLAIGNSGSESASASDSDSVSSSFGRFDRLAVLSEVAAAHGLSIEAVETGLYADLRAAQILTSFSPITAEHLVDLYELAQPQAVLLRATRVVIEVESAIPGAYRTLFRKLKFHRLLYTVRSLGPAGPTDLDRDTDLTPEPDPDLPPDPRAKKKPASKPARGKKAAAAASGPAARGYLLEIDGPFSLFESATRYGQALALALPAIRELDRWKLTAELRWGTQRTPLTFRLEGRGKTGDAELGLPDELAALVAGLEELLPGSGWSVAPATAILDLPGIGVCVPDLTFRHKQRRLDVHLEVLGYWSRNAVWRRVELVQAGLPHRIVFAVGQQLRVSEAALEGELPGALYVYKRTMSARAVLERVEAVAAIGPTKPS